MRKRFVLAIAILAAASLAFALGEDEAPSAPGSPARSPIPPSAPGSPARSPIPPSAPAPSAQGGTIGAEEALALLGGPNPPVLLDVRSAEVHAASHIAGALSIPLDELEENAVPALPVIDAPLLVYAESEDKSAEALRILQDLGYANARDLGAFASWPYQTEKGPWAREEKQGSLSSFATWDLWGHPVDEGVFRKADITMINIWGTFCPPCVREMPDLGRISRERKDGGFQIVGIVADVEPRKGVYAGRNLQDARTIAEKTNATYTHLLPSKDLTKAKLSTVSAIPETIFVDRQGKIIGSPHIGSKSKKNWDLIIDEVLSSIGK